MVKKEEAKEVVKNDPNDEKKFSQKDLEGLIHKTKMTERDKATKTLDAKTDGIDLDELVKSHAQLKKMQEEKNVEEGNFQKVISDQKEDYESKINKLSNQLAREKIDRNVISSASTNNAVEPSQVLNLIKNSFKLNDDGTIAVIDDTGNKRFTKDGTPLSIDDRVREFLDNNPHFVKSTAGSSVETKSAIGGGKPSPFDITNMTPAELADKMRDLDFREKFDKEHRSKRNSRIDVKTG